MKTALLTIASLALACSCATKQEAAQPSAVSAAQAAVPSADKATNPAAQASSDDIFKYTITTELADAPENIEILVAMNTLRGQSPAKYDLDCEGDGEFEYKGLTENQNCVYKKNSGQHQIFVRGEIPAMFLCERKPKEDPCHCPEGMLCDPCVSLFEIHPELRIVPEEGDYSFKAVVSIDSWGHVPWKSMRMFAAGCQALNQLPKDSPDLRQVKDMSFMFFLASAFNQPLEHWDVSNVTHMSKLFDGAKSFNQPIGSWNTSNVTDMNAMFYGATSFNQPIGHWDVSNVNNMHEMFHGATAFNQPLNQWDVSKVTNMNGMFAGAEEFSHYPKNWVVPANASKAMFAGTNVGAEAKASPLKTK